MASSLPNKPACLGHMACLRCFLGHHARDSVHNHFVIRLGPDWFQSLWLWIRLIVAGIAQPEITRSGLRSQRASRAATVAVRKGISKSLVLILQRIDALQRGRPVQCKVCCNVAAQICQTVRCQVSVCVFPHTRLWVMVAAAETSSSVPVNAIQRDYTGTHAAYRM